MFVINKIVDGLVNPLSIGVLALVAACVLLSAGRKRLGWGVCAGGFIWLWVWSTPIFANWVGVRLEGKWPPQMAEELPNADVIVVLGGGMSSCTNVSPYANMWAAGDRTWHAARLYKAGKAPLVVPTGGGASTCELPLLLDFGVPREAVVCEDEARNTEENAKRVAELLRRRNPEVDGRKPRMLLVTSAVHMRRAKLMYERYAPGFEIVPAACDHEALLSWGWPLRFGDFIPNAYSLSSSSYAFKEYIGYWGYKLLRR